MLIAVVAVAAACSSDDTCLTPEYGCSGVKGQPGPPTPLATPPLAQFETTINPILVSYSCGVGRACHQALDSERPYKHDVNATSGSAEMAANHRSMVEQFTCFDPLKGPFPQRLIDDPPHQGTTLAAAEVTAFQTWASQGEFPSYEECP